MCVLLFLSLLLLSWLVVSFVEVLGLPATPKIPQHPSLSGSGLESEIHGKDGHLQRLPPGSAGTAKRDSGPRLALLCELGTRMAAQLKETFLLNSFRLQKEAVNQLGILQKESVEGVPLFLSPDGEPLKKNR